MKWFLYGALCALLFPLSALAEEPATAHLSRFATGAGPSRDGIVYRLLDAERTPGQSNAIAFDREHEGAYEDVSFTGRLRVLEGGDGGAFVFLNTAAFGARGPAPFVKSWVEPNFKGTFAVGIDVHDPPNEEPFGPWGNVLGNPEREVSLHWDGREIAKRLAAEEFRGDDGVDVAIAVRHVIGGAEVTVQFGEAKVYDAYFIAGLLPYESRLAIGAGTRADATTEFDVTDVRFEVGETARNRRPPLHVEVFNHVLTDNSQTAYEAEVQLPPANWAFGRVILTLDIHDAGASWDEWDRCGHISILDAERGKLGIVPFITSYRTPCHWKVDVTHFRPWLTGKTKLEIAAGTTFYKNRGYMMSVSLDYYHGTPELEPYAITPLWVGTAKYQSAENHFQDFFTPQAVTLGAETRAARVFTTTTGHSQVGEFTPSKRALAFDGSEIRHRYEDVLWKTDCYLNPNRPQYGTWKYPRAGWAPGDVVWPWWVDLTPHVEPGQELVLHYEPEPYDFGDAPNAPSDEEIAKASHIVRSYLIEYRDPGQLVSAPILLVTGVQDGSNAAKAGMKQGDWLAVYDGMRVDSIDDLRAALQAAAASSKEKVQVVVFRGAERIELELDPGRMGVNLGGS